MGELLGKGGDWKGLGVPLPPSHPWEAQGGGGGKVGGEGKTDGVFSGDGFVSCAPSWAVGSRSGLARARTTTHYCLCWRQHVPTPMPPPCALRYRCMCTIGTMRHRVVVLSKSQEKCSSVTSHPPCTVEDR